MVRELTGRRCLSPNFTFRNRIQTTGSNATGWYYLHIEDSESFCFFSMDVLHQRDSLYGGIGLPDWQLTLCLALSWFIIFVSLFEGPKRYGI